ncbi:MAG: MTH1187 family thiamine-binding protein [Armatimonadota bacterium]
MPTIVEVSVVPVGTGNCSMGDLVAETLKTVKAEGVEFELNAMGTNMEGDLDELLGVARKMHEVCFEHGAERTVTIIKIDDRRDKDLTMAYKVDSVLERAK